MEDSFLRRWTGRSVRALISSLILSTVLTAVHVSSPPDSRQLLLLADALATPRSYLSLSRFSVRPAPRQFVLSPRNFVAYRSPCGRSHANQSLAALICTTDPDFQSQAPPRFLGGVWDPWEDSPKSGNPAGKQNFLASLRGQEESNSHCSISPSAWRAPRCSAGLGRRGPLAYIWRRKNAEDKLPHLLAFVGEECEYCKMEPVEKAVEGLLPGTNIRRLEVWHNTLNYELLQELDRDGKCGGLPFYFNMRTLQWICGATTKANLLAWAAHQPCKSHEPPVLQAEDLEIFNRRTGMVARMMRRVDKMRHEGERAIYQTLLQQRQGREREQAEQQRLQREEDLGSTRKD
ncbi:conserved hypothetical protein [Neospora caninum Liverpool]|uniref:Uncharacterized protein n=1 Tax=Neospora caninum (strain Liverpool) TaxID=572307 RepID=F0VMW1_NEOCL|nr:conserved hypothetical protein [Neospora caninum Liverpool]CBZ55057.1 conserved hypothetical protein [Neospora caninum Liverpool]|eukprot:XP_003885085.1 conserved hypothetical protein [Neospora caninum Liverpool]